MLRFRPTLVILTFAPTLLGAQPQGDTVVNDAAAGAANICKHVH